MSTTFSPSRVNTAPTPSAAWAVAAFSMSAAVSPGMKVATARRTNGAFTPCSRIHWLSEILSRAVRARLMRDHDTMSAVCAATDSRPDGTPA